METTGGNSTDVKGHWRGMLQLSRFKPVKHFNSKQTSRRIKKGKLAGTGLLKEFNSQSFLSSQKVVLWKLQPSNRHVAFVFNPSQADVLHFSGIYLFKFNNENTSTMCEIWQLRHETDIIVCFGALIVNFEEIWCNFDATKRISECHHFCKWKFLYIVNSTGGSFR